MLNKITTSSKKFHSFTQLPSFNILSNINTHLNISTILSIKDTLHSWNINNLLSLSSPESQLILPVIITSSLIRLLQIPIYKVIKRLTLNKKEIFKKKHKEKIEKSLLNRSLNEDLTYISALDKVFIYDLKKDCKIRRMTVLEYKYYKSFYSLETILSYIIQYFLILYNLKSIYIIESFFSITNTGLVSNSLFSLLFLSNLLSLKYSRHPFLINISNIQYAYLSFFVSLVGLFFSKLICISWISYCFTHFAVSLINFKMLNYKLNRLSLKSYYSCKKGEYQRNGYI